MAAFFEKKYMIKINRTKKNVFYLDWDLFHFRWLIIFGKKLHQFHSWSVTISNEYISWLFKLLTKYWDKQMSNFNNEFIKKIRNRNLRQNCDLKKYRLHLALKPSKTYCYQLLDKVRWNLFVLASQNTTRWESWDFVLFDIKMLIKIESNIALSNLKFSTRRFQGDKQSHTYNVTILCSRSPL